MRVLARSASHRFSFLLGVAFVASMVLAIPCAHAAESDLKYEREAAKGINKFAIDMYLELAKSDDGNILFSPYSLYTTLAMAYAGTRGDDAEELAKAMHFSPDVRLSLTLLSRQIECDSSIRVANGIWPAPGRARRLAPLVERPESTKMLPLNYATEPGWAQNAINNWTEEKTNGRIKEIVPKGGVGKTTGMVLTSTATFSSELAMRFHQATGRITIREEFYPSYPDLSNRVAVQRVARINTVRYLESHGAQLLCLPCRDDRFSMIYIMPSPDLSILQYEKTLTHNRFLDDIQQLRSGSFPKQKIVIDILQKNETRIMKEDVLKTSQTNFFINEDKIYYGNALEIEAVAQSGLDSGASNLSELAHLLQSLPIFEMNRPFIYLLAETKIGTILLMGRFVKPE